MVIVGKIVLYIIMACCAAGAIADVIKPGSGLGNAFHEGIGVITALFIPIIALMVSVPFLIIGVEKLFGGIYGLIGADLAVAANTFIPVDCGGYMMALEMAKSPEIAVLCISVAIMAAGNFSFNIPVGLSLLRKEDHPYFALGMMSGILSIPFGVFLTGLAMKIFHPVIRTVYATTGESTYQLNVNMTEVLINILPILVFCIILAVCLKLFPKAMVKVFQIYGKILLGALTLIFAASVIEYYTGIFSSTVGWGFDPMFGDELISFRSVETLGSIAMMLSGAYPMVYLIRKFFGKALAKAGGKIGLDEAGSASLIAGMANAIALFGLVKEMNPKSKVMALSFVVCAGYCIGDFLAFNMNFQPNMMIPVLIGQFGGGLIGLIIARILTVPAIKKIQ